VKGGFTVAIDLEEQYDKIYRYCYFKLRSRESAEDITQESCLRYLERYADMPSGDGLKCLYTIARNLCVDELRLRRTVPEEPVFAGEDMEERWITKLDVRAALAKLDGGEQELLLLRYVNEVPVRAIGALLGISRFSVYRRLAEASGKFREELRREEHHESMETGTKTGV